MSCIASRYPAEQNCTLAEVYPRYIKAVSFKVRLFINKCVIYLHTAYIIDLIKSKHF